MRQGVELEGRAARRAVELPDVVTPPEPDRLPRVQGWSFAVALSMTMWALIVLAAVLAVRACT